MINKAYKERFKSRLFGLLCEYEKDREWKRFLDTIMIELIGFAPEERNEAYWHLSHNLNTLRYLSYDYFRSTIFDCMTLVDKL